MEGGDFRNRKRGRGDSEREDGLTEEQRVDRAKMSEQMQRLLQEKGICDVQVTGVHRVSSAGSIVYKCRNSGTRRCLVREGETHVSNNPYIVENSDGNVYYKCLAPLCSKMRPHRIGYLRH